MQCIFMSMLVYWSQSKPWCHTPMIEIWVLLKLQLFRKKQSETFLRLFGSVLVPQCPSRNGRNGTTLPLRLLDRPTGIMLLCCLTNRETPPTMNGLTQWQLCAGSSAPMLKTSAGLANSFLTIPSLRIAWTLLGSWTQSFFVLISQQMMLKLKVLLRPVICQWTRLSTDTVVRSIQLLTRHYT